MLFQVTSDTIMHMYYLPDDDLGIFAYLVHSQVVVESASTQDPKDPSGREAHHGYLKKVVNQIQMYVVYFRIVILICMNNYLSLIYVDNNCSTYTKM